MQYEDKRPTYMTPEARIEQAKRLLPLAEGEIAAGDTRAFWFDIRDMCLRDLEAECECIGTARCVKHFLKELDEGL